MFKTKIGADHNRYVSLHIILCNFEEYPEFNWIQCVCLFDSKRLYPNKTS